MIRRWGHCMTRKNFASRRDRGVWHFPFRQSPTPAARCARSARRPSIRSPRRWPSASRAPIRSSARRSSNRPAPARGFKLFCAGVGERFPDISNASRRMKASEAKPCAANGVTEVTEIQIGLDGLALATVARARRSPASPSATSIWRSPRRRSASRTRPRPGRTSMPSCRRFRSASTARRRPAARATALARADDDPAVRGQCRAWPR